MRMGNATQRSVDRVIVNDVKSEIALKYSIRSYTRQCKLAVLARNSPN